MLTLAGPAQHILATHHLHLLLPSTWLINPLITASDTIVPGTCIVLPVPTYLTYLPNLTYLRYGTDYAHAHHSSSGSRTRPFPVGANDYNVALAPSLPDTHTALSHPRPCLLSVHERISQSLFAGPQPSLIPHPVIPRALRLASFCARATTDLEAGPWPASQATPNHLHSTSRVTCASNAQSPVPPAGACVMLQEMLPVAPRPLLLAVCRLSCTTNACIPTLRRTYLPILPTSSQRAYPQLSHGRNERLAYLGHIQITLDKHASLFALPPITTLAAWVSDLSH